MRAFIAMGMVLAGLPAFGPAGVLADASSSPGKFMAAASQSGLALNTYPSVSVQIVKGKKKRILEVACLAATNFSSGIMSASVFVNGIAAEPGEFTIPQKCNSSACSVSGTWVGRPRRRGGGQSRQLHQRAARCGVQRPQ